MVKDLLPQLHAAANRTSRTSLGTAPPETYTNGKHTYIEMQPLNTTDRRTMSSSCGDFLHAIEGVINNINSIKNNNQKVRKLQVDILRGINQQQVENDKTQLDCLMESNKKLGNLVRNALKREQGRLAAANADNENLTPKEKDELRVRQTQIAAQGKRFYDLWSEFNNLQTEYRDRLKLDFKRITVITGNEGITDADIDEMLDEGKTHQFTTYLKESKEEKDRLNMLQVRHSEFLKLEESIREVHDLFLELASMVSQQGELINNLEHNVGEAGEKVQEAVVEIKKAEQYQRSARKKKLICYLILFIVLVILISVIVILLWPDDDKGKTSSTSN